MKLRGLKRRSATLLVAGALSFVVGYSLCAGGQSGAGVDLPSTGAQAPGHGAAGSSTVPVCGAGERDGAAKKLDLTAVRGEALQFKCAPSMKLSPAGSSDNNFDLVYQYSADASTKNCSTTGKGTPLNTLVTGAQLTSAMATRDQVLPGPEPVYSFLYNTEPEGSKYLCYTCGAQVNKASRTLEGAAPDCTVYIEVPGKPPASDAPSTEAPHSTSDSRAVTALAATVMGGFVLVVLPL